MVDYIAEKNNCGIYLSKTKQLDEYLKNGFSIYKLTNNDKQLIASPEKGYLVNKPSLEIMVINKGE